MPKSHPTKTKPQAPAGTINPPAAEKAARAFQVSQQIQPLLSGLGPELQGAILADLFALYLAGHMGPGAESSREEIIKAWLDTVRKLVPFCEQQILARLKEEIAH